MVVWADYSGGYPGGDALRAAGFTGVIRYVGLGRPGKRITTSEYQDLISAGLRVLLVAELNTHDSEGGYQAGRANATTALADARILGIPDTVGIGCAADEHLTVTQLPAAVAYAQGFESVIGHDRCGIYGFSEFTNACRAAGIGSWYWRCGSQPDSADQEWLNFWQRNTGGTSVAGVTVDINDQYNPIQGDDDMTPDQDNKLTSVWNAVFFGGGDAGPLSIIQRLENLQTAADSIQAGLTQEEADLLAAIKAQGTPTVDPAGLVAAGLPQDVAQALLTALAKAATG